MKINLLPFKKFVFACCLLVIAAANGNAQVLFDNGPYFNSVGTGAGGANESVLYTTTFAMGTIGFGHQQTAFNRVADDFVNPNCRWIVDSIVFFGYQTGSPLTSTFTNYNFRIWDSIPDAVGSSIVYGDTTTNRLTATRFSGAYRITETTTGNTQRPIMRNVCATPGLILNGGTYWLDWSTAGSLASGPWAPPRTPIGVAISGNGKQRTGNTWNNAVDGGTGNPAQGFPFIIYGQSINMSADAGMDQGICPGNSTMIGGTPPGIGGQGTLSYSWSPSTGLSSSVIGNPIASPSSNTNYVLTVSDSLGCIITDTVVVTVGSVASNFLPNDTALCANGTITLDAGTASSYLWSNGATSQTITVGPGVYSVQAFDGQGCASVDSITVSPAQEAFFTGDTLLCAGATGTLTAVANGGTFLWNTGATTQSISISAAGSYSLTYTSPEGCVSLFASTVNQAPSAAAAFSFMGNSGGLSYSFTDLSTGGPLSYAWDFGDGNSSTASNPTHVYAASGNYTVTLLVTNACGTDTVSQSLTVVSIEGSLAGSQIDIAPNPATAAFQLNVSGLEVGSLNVELMDLQGKVLRNFHVEDATGTVNLTIDGAKLARGTYMLRLENNGIVEVRKVVLQ